MVQKTFQVLPTDKRFQDLTTEQLDLMYEHFLLDNPPTEDNKLRDDDYDIGDDSAPDEGGDIPAVEHFEDPDFDSAWNDTDNGSSYDEDEYEEV